MSSYDYEAQLDRVRDLTLMVTGTSSADPNQIPVELRDFSIEQLRALV